MAQQVAILSESAAELVRRGQPDDAAKVYERIHEIAPYNLGALDFLTTRAFEQNDLERCLQLLERVCQVNPNRPRTHLNLAVVYRARADFPAALQAIDQALQLRPVFPNALLHKGAILEDMGREQEALKAYFRAFLQSPSLRIPAETPPHLRQLAAHGNELVAQATLKRLDAALAPIRAGHSSNVLRRIEEFVDIYLGRRPPQYAHVGQRPTFLYFPGLEPRPFFEREAFDWCAGLESATAEIRAELLAVLQEPDQLRPYVDIAGADAAQWTTLNKSLNWSSFHLYKAGQRVEENCRRCPATLAAVEELPLARTPGHSPEVFFSILKPGTYIPPHFGLANYKVAVHLPLIVPPDCAIRVGNETRGWQEGRCLAFDDSFRHEAWNNSGELRAVLILDAWNPQLSAPERSAVAALLSAIQETERDYGDAGSPG
jgi:aspartate beta-hydroxylase